MTEIAHANPYLIEVCRWLRTWSSLLLWELLLLYLPLLLARLDVDREASRAVFSSTTHLS